ncbi:MAG: pyridoxal 5'-phosphate synthase glutaminase subunit PdxT [Chloroflexi bacterium]|nr:pyridoxal 5'-phosphate synthase glutaminase subunit PdxT [Chloroflexota bacterium]
MTCIGVLALQGDFAEHMAALRNTRVETIEVRVAADLDRVDALVIPGGESTTITTLMREYEIDQKVKALAAQGLPVLGTCAGMIVLAQHIVGMEQASLGLIDIDVRRNAFGRQVDSFEADLKIPVLGELPVRAVFIRAPIVERTGPSVQVLARLSNGTPVAAQQGSVLVTAFHPELTSDTRFHRYFVSLAARRKAEG